jgi:hypothetical protein
VERAILNHVLSNVSYSRRHLFVHFVWGRGDVPMREERPVKRRGNRRVTRLPDRRR